MKVKTVSKEKHDEIHINQVSVQKRTIQVRFGPESGMAGRGSRTVWLNIRDARIFAYTLLAETERILWLSQQK